MSTTNPMTEDRFELEGVEFVSSYRADSTSTSFFIRKQPDAIQAFTRVLEELDRPNILELGIAGGGSAAFMSLVARPRKLVAIELEETPVAGLAGFVEDRGLGDVVRTYYGVDQADRARLAAIVEDEFGDEPIDLVVDDASHLLGPTRASFEVLFPRLRPGGRYLIEDWNWQPKLLSRVGAPPGAPDRWSAQMNAALERNPASRAMFEAQVLAALADGDAPNHELVRRRFEQVAAGDQPEPATTEELMSAFGPTDSRDEPPLLSLVFQLVLARAEAAEGEAAIDRVTFDSWWADVRRGHAHLDPATFRVADLYDDVNDLLAGQQTGA